MTFNYEAAKKTVDTNYFGVKTTVSALLPLLRSSENGARIVFIGSELGQLKVSDKHFFLLL